MRPFDRDADKIRRFLTQAGHFGQPPARGWPTEKKRWTG
jgi:hypothetical protein